MSVSIVPSVHVGAFEFHRPTREGKNFLGQRGSCAICLERLDEDDKGYRFYRCEICDQLFHASCAKSHWESHGQQISEYVVNNAGHKCPLCRSEWPVKDFPNALGGIDPVWERTIFVYRAIVTEMPSLTDLVSNRITIMRRNAKKLTSRDLSDNPFCVNVLYDLFSTLSRLPRGTRWKFYERVLDPRKSPVNVILLFLGLDCWIPSSYEQLTFNVQLIQILFEDGYDAFNKLNLIKGAMQVNDFDCVQTYAIILGKKRYRPRIELDATMTEWIIRKLSHENDDRAKNEILDVFKLSPTVDSDHTRSGEV